MKAYPSRLSIMKAAVFLILLTMVGRAQAPDSLKPTTQAPDSLKLTAQTPDSLKDTTQILTEYQRAYEEGKKIGEKEADELLWCLIGVATNCTGLAVSYALYPGEPPPIYIINKAETYRIGFKDGYFRGKKSRTVRAAWIGCLGSVMPFVIMLVLSWSPW